MKYNYSEHIITVNAHLNHHRSFKENAEFTGGRNRINN